MHYDNSGFHFMIHFHAKPNRVFLVNVTHKLIMMHEPILTFSDIRSQALSNDACCEGGYGDISQQQRGQHEATATVILMAVQSGKALQRLPPSYSFTWHGLAN